MVIKVQVAEILEFCLPNILDKINFIIAIALFSGLSPAFRYLQYIFHSFLCAQEEPRNTQECRMMLSTFVFEPLYCDV